MLGKLQTYKLQPTKFYEKGHRAQFRGDENSSTPWLASRQNVSSLIWFRISRSPQLVILCPFRFSRMFCRQINDTDLADKVGRQARKVTDPQMREGPRKRECVADAEDKTNHRVYSSLTSDNMDQGNMEGF